VTTTDVTTRVRACGPNGDPPTGRSRHCRREAHPREERTESLVSADVIATDAQDGLDVAMALARPVIPRDDGPEGFL